jgi:type I restriction enzyme S subunit
MTPEGWTIPTLGDVADVAIGGTPARNNPAYWDPEKRSGNRWVAISDLKDRVVAETAEQISALGVQKSNVKLVRAGTPIMSFKLSIGRIALAGRDLYTNEAIAAFRVRGSLDPVFLLYALPRTAELHGEADVAVKGKTLNKAKLVDLPLLLPPLPEQRKIAAILTSVDEAIEGAQTVIDQLQVVKKAMMADLLTRGIPGRHKKFKQTEIGEVPEKWEVVPLGDLLDGINAGWSPQCESRPAGPKEWGVLKVSAVSWGEFRQEENKLLPSSLVPREEIEVRSGDILVSRANTPELVGRAVIVRATRSQLMLCDKIFRLRTDQTKVDSAYLNLVLGSPNSRAQIQDGASGSSRSMKNISQEKLRNVLVQRPALAEQRQIAVGIDALADRVVEEKAVLASLSALKSALMSVLLTGEVRVRVAEGVSA